MSKKRKVEFHHRLMGYTAAAGAALVVGGEAEAVIHGTTGRNIMVRPGQMFDLDINRDGVTDLKFGLNTVNNHISSGFNVGGTNTYVNGPWTTIKRYYYGLTYTNRSTTGNAYVRALHANGRIATSARQYPGARVLGGTDTIDAALMASGAAN